MDFNNTIYKGGRQEGSKGAAAPSLNENLIFIQFL